MGELVLQNGIKIPDIGFGTYLITDGNGGEKILLNAVEAGYRLFDTASFYENEEMVGRALRNSGLPREDFFITSKLWKTDMGYEKAKESFDLSCQKLGTDYLDMLLIHWPFTDCDDWKKRNIDTWRAMEELYKEGRIRAIGVSNFYPMHLKNLMENCRIMPMINQIEFHPGFTQWAVVDYCRQHNILLQAWQPFGRKRVLGDVRVKSLAQKYGVTPAQLCVRYAMQEGLLPLAKSSELARMRENMDVRNFQISEEDVYYIRCFPQFGWSGEHPDFETDETALTR